MLLALALCAEGGTSEGRELPGVLGLVLNLSLGLSQRNLPVVSRAALEGKQGWVCLFPVNSDNGCIEKCYL